LPSESQPRKSGGAGSEIVVEILSASDAVGAERECSHRAQGIAARVSTGKREGVGSCETRNWSLEVNGTAAGPEAVETADQPVTGRRQNEIKVKGCSRGHHKRAGATTVLADLVSAARTVDGLADLHAEVTGVVDVNRASRDTAFAIGRYGPRDGKGDNDARTVDVRAGYGDDVGAS